MTRVISSSLLAFFFVACSSEAEKVEEDGPKTSDDGHTWRYFDREVYLPTGASVQPEMAAAHELIQASLTDLAKNSDLGQDYFLFKSEEDSLLQPITKETIYEGRPWYSFIQVWPDDLFNDHQLSAIGSASDEDVIVALNEHNEKEFYVIFRLSCFVAGESCGFPTQGQSKAVVWRAFGYLVGLRHSGDANSSIMKPGVSPSQESAEEIKKYLAEFDGQLERVRNDLPAPK